MIDTCPPWWPAVDILDGEIEVDTKHKKSENKIKNELRKPEETAHEEIIFN